jgi:hypothetical protein
MYPFVYLRRFVIGGERASRELLIWLIFLGLNRFSYGFDGERRLEKAASRTSQSFKNGLSDQAATATF